MHGKTGKNELTEEAQEQDYIYFSKEDENYGFLSNFYPAEFVDKDSFIWPTSEHFYQAMKSPYVNHWEQIRQASTPQEAKRLGQELKVHPNREWNDMKVKVMAVALQYKFAMGSELAQWLLDTGDDILVEYAPWGDTFWGVDTSYTGKNTLGKLLMGRRQELQVFS